MSIDVKSFDKNLRYFDFADLGLSDGNIPQGQGEATEWMVFEGLSKVGIYLNTTLIVPAPPDGLSLNLEAKDRMSGQAMVLGRITGDMPIQAGVRGIVITLPDFDFSHAKAAQYDPANLWLGPTVNPLSDFNGSAVLGPQAYLRLRLISRDGNIQLNKISITLGS